MITLFRGSSGAADCFLELLGPRKIAKIATEVLQFALAKKLEADPLDILHVVVSCYINLSA